MNFLDGISDPQTPNEETPHKRSSGVGVIALLVVLLGILGLMIIKPDTESTDDKKDSEQTVNHQLFKFEPQVASEKDDKSTEEKTTEPKETTVKEEDPIEQAVKEDLKKTDTKEEPQNSEIKSFTVRVANGSNTTGLAGKYADSLKDKGFNVVTINNANSVHAKTTIYYLKGKKSSADMIATELGEPAVELEEFEEGDISDSADIIIVLGSDRDK